MAWVRRAEPPALHNCEPPTRPVPTAIQRRAGVLPVAIHAEPDGHLGDLWRCDGCGKLWRIADACDVCDANDHHRLPGGLCTVGLTWRPARWWQRLWYRDRGTGTRCRPEKIARGGQVPAPNAKEPPVRDRVPTPPPSGRIDPRRSR